MEKLGKCLHYYELPSFQYTDDGFHNLPAVLIDQVLNQNHKSYQLVDAPDALLHGESKSGFMSNTVDLYRHARNV